MALAQVAAWPSTHCSLNSCKTVTGLSEKRMYEDKRQRGVGEICSLSSCLLTVLPRCSVAEQTHNKVRNLTDRSVCDSEGKNSAEPLTNADLNNMKNVNSDAEGRMLALIQKSPSPPLLPSMSTRPSRKVCPPHAIISQSSQESLNKR